MCGKCIVSITAKEPEGIEAIAAKLNDFYPASSKQCGVTFLEASKYLEVNNRGTKNRNQGIIYDWYKKARDNCQIVFEVVTAVNGVKNLFNKIQKKYCPDSIREVFWCCPEEKEGDAK